MYGFLFIISMIMMIVLHEFGHFIMGRILKVPICEFSVGMGPKLFQVHDKTTFYTLRLLPIGGYCSFASWDSDNKLIDDVLEKEPAWKRFLISIAGVTMNMITAFILFIIVTHVLGNSLSLGDLISGFFENIKNCFQALLTLPKAIFGTPIAEQQGFVSTVQTVNSSSQQYGAPFFIAILIVTNIMLAIFNFLPIPALDGWMTAECLVEMVSHKKLPEKVERALQAGAWTAIIALNVWVAAVDLIKPVWASLFG